MAVVGSPLSPLRDRLPVLEGISLSAPREGLADPFPIVRMLGITPSSGVFRSRRVLPGDVMLLSARCRKTTTPALTVIPIRVPNDMLITGCGLYGWSGALAGSTIRI